MRLEQITAEMARRYIRFHNGEDWRTIKLFGLFNWGDVSKYLVCNHKAKSFKKGLLITDMCKSNKIIWVRPTAEFWNDYIYPMLLKHKNNGRLPELTRLAGWCDIPNY